MSKSTLRSAARSRFSLLLIFGFIVAVVLTQQIYFASRVRAANFTAGNIVVYRVGDGTAALGSTATAVFLDEYTPSGTLVQSVRCRRRWLAQTDGLLPVEVLPTKDS
jgi:hypothetical protein